MVSEKLLQKLLNKADFEIISPRFINWYQLRECWQFTKQLRRIYDSTLDRRPLSGKVIWRKISELKKNWRKVVANESKTEVWKGGKYVWEFWVFAVVVRLNLLRLVGSSQFWPSHLVTVLPYSCFILNFLKCLRVLFNDGKWCAFFVEQKQSHFIKLNDTTTVFDVVGMHDRDK